MMKRHFYMLLILLAVLLFGCSRAQNDPSLTEPTESDSAAETTVTEPVTIVLVTTEPVVTEPVTTVPVATEPLTTEVVVTQPIVTEPIVIEPIQTEPIQTEPIVTEPVVIEPIQTEPLQTEPVATEPVVTEPIQTEPPVTESQAADTEPPSETDAPSPYEITSLSPDGTKLLGLELAVDDAAAPLYGNMYRVHLLDAVSGEVIATALTEVDAPQIHWSHDSRYVGISYGYNRYYTAAIVLDTVNGREIVLPHIEISKQIFGALTNRWGDIFYGFHTVPQSWHGDMIYVEMFGSTSAEWMEGQVGGIVGYYTFDLKTLSTVECVYLPFYNLTTLPPPDRDAEQIIHDSLLLIAGDGSIRDTQVLISQNGDAYAAILALGDEAKIYLKEVYYTNHGPYDPSQEYLYAAKDIAAEALAALGEAVN